MCAFIYTQAMLVLLAIILCVGQGFAETNTRFTNVECEVMDPSFAKFLKCDLKIIGRGIVGLNIQLRYFKLHRKVLVNLSLWKKFNGYRPFMYNMTFDFCTMMKKVNSLSFETLFFMAARERSNLNHSCPYDQKEDLIVKDLVIKEEFLKFFPLPSGSYKHQVLMTTTNVWQVKINFHYVRNEDLMKS